MPCWISHVHILILRLVRDVITDELRDFLDSSFEIGLQNIPVEHLNLSSVICHERLDILSRPIGESCGQLGG